MAGGGSQPINGLKKFKNKKGKLLKFTKPFFCLSIPTARLRINFFLPQTDKLSVPQFCVQHMSQLP
jgi:hypothetical protein